MFFEVTRLQHAHLQSGRQTLHFHVHKSSRNIRQYGARGRCTLLFNEPFKSTLLEL